MQNSATGCDYRPGIAARQQLSGRASRSPARLISEASSIVPAESPLDEFAISPEDDALLEEIERATFLYFWEQADPQTGSG